MAKTQRSECGGAGFHAGQGARSHLSQLKIPSVATKIRHRQFNYKMNLLKKLLILLEYNIRFNVKNDCHLQMSQC